MSVTAVEKNVCIRTEERTPVIGNVFYNHSIVDNNQLFIEGVTANISLSGASIYTFTEIEEDVAIVLYGKVLGNAQKNAIVRWCEKVNNEIYKVGLSFQMSNM